MSPSRRSTHRLGALGRDFLSLIGHGFKHSWRHARSDDTAEEPNVAERLPDGKGGGATTRATQLPRLLDRGLGVV